MSNYTRRTKNPKTDKFEDEATPQPDWLDEIIEKFADYCACDEYHYGPIDGQPGNHDPDDGHIEFDEEQAKHLIQQHIAEEIQKAEIAIYRDIIKNVTKPETIGAHFLHAEVEEFAKQLEEYLLEKIEQLSKSGEEK